MSRNVKAPRPRSAIVYFDVAESFGTAKHFCDLLREHHVWMVATGPQRIRFTIKFENYKRFSADSKIQYAAP